MLLLKQALALLLKLHEGLADVATNWLYFKMLHDSLNETTMNNK